MLSAFAKAEKASHAAIIQMRDAQERLARAVMNRPTYDEFEKMVFADDNVIKKQKQKLKDLVDQFNKSKKDLTAQQIKILTGKIEQLEFFIGYIMPENTFGFLTSWALGADVSEVKSLTRDELLKAAVLAKNAKKAACDFISGVFTDRDKAEIETAAWVVFNEWCEKNEKVKKRN
jgi:uncharacterized coiled-coil protein SlyX